MLQAPIQNQNKITGIEISGSNDQLNSTQGRTQTAPYFRSMNWGKVYCYLVSKNRSRWSRSHWQSRQRVPTGK